MSFYYANARQPEIIRTIQKDSIFSDYVGNNLSDILRFSNNKLWIKYNNLSKLIGELLYHGFLTANNLQTLGEEYTGIIQIDSQYISLPSKCLQFLTIILEFTGEQLFMALIRNTEKHIRLNDDLLPNAKEKLLKFCSIVHQSIPYVKAFHRSLFYFYGGKLQISKRLTGINYVLIRYWLNVNYSIYGYKILGSITMLQLMVSFLSFLKVFFTQQLPPLKKQTPKKPLHRKQLENGNEYSNKEINVEREIKYETIKNTLTNINSLKCVLCLELRKSTSVTQCGHLFCWNCILDWLQQKEECPICRESIKKSTIVCLQNFL